MKLPRAVQNLIEKFEKLPGIGPKSAQRLVFYLLHNPEHELEDFAEKITALKKNTVLCKQCHNVSETDPCSICSDANRENQNICVDIDTIVISHSIVATHLQQSIILCENDEMTITANSSNDNILI